MSNPEKYNWWLNELDSLGINTLQKNRLNNQKEASDLTDAVKQTLYEEYLQAYTQVLQVHIVSRGCALVMF
jgi:hypothetical protein